MDIEAGSEEDGECYCGDNASKHEDGEGACNATDCPCPAFDPYDPDAEDDDD